MGFSKFTDSNDLNDKYDFPNECDNKNCIYMTNDGCRFEYCIFDDAFPKLENETSRYTCEMCGEEFERDNKSMEDHVCDKCKKIMSKITNKHKSTFTCSICGQTAEQDSDIPASEICRKCFIEIARSVLIARDLYDKDEFERKWGI